MICCLKQKKIKNKTKKKQEIVLEGNNEEFYFNDEINCESRTVNQLFTVLG